MCKENEHEYIAIQETEDDDIKTETTTKIYCKKCGHSIKI